MKDEVVAPLGSPNKGVDCVELRVDRKLSQRLPVRKQYLERTIFSRVGFALGSLPSSFIILISPGL